MTKAQLKSEITKFAKEENISFVEACKSMQSAASKMGNEKLITIIHEIKMAEVLKDWHQPKY